MEIMKCEKFYDELSSIGKRINFNISEILNELLKDREDKFINIYPYIREYIVGNWYFYDTDKNGNGEALELNSIEIRDGRIICTMYTNYGDYFGEYSIDDWTPQERAYLLNILEDIVFYLEKGGKLLGKDEDFEDED